MLVLPEMRPQARYRTSLQVLRRARQWADHHRSVLSVKTGIMVGVGETHEEVVEVMRDAASAGVQIMTIGQYLQPSRAHHPVVRYWEPREFDDLAAAGRSLGLAWVEAGPLVRSSYHARRQSASFGDANRAAG